MQTPFLVRDGLARLVFSSLFPVAGLQINFLVGFDTTLAGIEGCRLTRCGYTGEDGFELSVRPATDHHAPPFLGSNCQLP